MENFEFFLRTGITQIVLSIVINFIHSIFLVEDSQLKNQSPRGPMAHLNRAEVKKADIPVLGKDSVDSKKTDDRTSIKINPYRKIKGMCPRAIIARQILIDMIKVGMNGKCSEHYDELRHCFRVQIS